jgi:antitoxin (DNA-binding transcriptional repressor) of toxin-antitoxin stability system
MLKRIPAARFRQELSSVLDSVQNNREEYLIERAGKALAAVVPVDIALRREQAKKRLRSLMNQPTAFDQMTERAFDRMINREVQAVRRLRRRQSST